MKNFVVTFFYENDKTYQAIVPETLLESYMESLKNNKVFWSENKDYSAWINMSKVMRVIAVEHKPEQKEKKEEKERDQ